MARISTTLTPRALSKPALDAAVQKAMNNDAARPVLENCMAENLKVARYRSSILYSTGSFTTSSGVIGQSSIDLFKVQLGGTDGNSITMTESETNMLRAGTLGQDAFVAEQIGFYVCNLTAEGAEANVGEYAYWLGQVYNGTSAQIQIGTSDVQRIGPIGCWPANVTQPVVSLATAATTAAAGTALASVNFGTAAALQDLGPQLYIGPQSNFSVKLTFDRVEPETNLDDATWGIKCFLYGKSWTPLDG